MLLAAQLTSAQCAEKARARGLLGKRTPEGVPSFVTDYGE